MKKYLLLLPFFLSFFVINNSYAVNDIVQHFDSTNSGGWVNLCQNYGTPLCSDYSYLVVEFYDLEVTDARARNQTVTFDVCVAYDSSSCTSSVNSPIRCTPFISSKCIFKIQDFGFSSLTLIQFSSTNLAYFGSDWSYDVTLTNSISSCPDPEPCPVVPDTPYGEKFDNIEKAIYVCGAILIMLYFFYCIYRMIIKGSGVN